MSRDPGAPPQAAAVPVGRRVVLGMAVLGGAGILLGSRVQGTVAGAIGSVGGSGGAASLLPGADRFRFYTITDSFPDLAPAEYRLEVSGLVERPASLTLADLRSLPSTQLVRDFQCVTGWRVPKVHWEGVRLSHLLDAAGVRRGAAALAFESYDGADSESLTLDQARLPDVIVAYRMLGAPITSQ
ncbi:MAG: molybdopterin-dependent oxidoreductase, partial [Solirubrobacteraceae bacterium]